VKGIFLWVTGHPDLAEKLDFSKLCDLPEPWPEELHLREPWQKANNAADGPVRDYRVSEKRADKPVIFVAGACNSAMPLAWHFADMNCLPEWGSVICIRQLQGKGLLGRGWISPPGNLYAAVRLPESSADFSGMMSLVFGYATIRVLQERGLPAKLKWPNDIIIDGKKAGGILVQNRRGISVAGVGLNLVSAPDTASLRAAHAVPATHLAAAGHRATPLSLWEQLVDRGSFFLEEVLGDDVPSAIGRIQSQMAFIDQPVRVDDHGGDIYSAKLLGLSEDGGLILDVENEKRIIRSGSIAPCRTCERSGRSREDI
jgi:BirA family biotin operon repressor/biotin-[acetyl-CoA-carboxylase] ligase